MSSQREMTLEEWVRRLPETHAARLEYESLKRELATQGADMWHAGYKKGRADHHRGPMMEESRSAPTTYGPDIGSDGETYRWDPEEGR